MRGKSLLIALTVALTAGVGAAGWAAYGDGLGAPEKSASIESAAVQAGLAASVEVTPRALAVQVTASPSATGAAAAGATAVVPSPAAATPKAWATTQRPLPRRTIVVDPNPPPLYRKPVPLPTGQKCPYHEGVDAPKAEVKLALEAAAAKRFWTVSNVQLPVNLIKAVGWMESGWQSTIIACDGGIGTMQVMPDTATWMNERFDTDYNVHTLEGNTMIGSAYLQWLIKYFGDAYFGGSYTLTAADCAKDPNVADYKEPCLLNAVIAAYNYGYGAVDTPSGLVIPNPQYTEPVRALMTNCPCFAY
ncbi:MAG: lytic transglycosylase domain-containing protein [Hamadaea sp.]|nr:lytic transglycosylase domain-containing protein [Hamadaea sp.]